MCNSSNEIIRVYRPQQELKKELFSNFLELGFKKVSEKENDVFLEIPNGWNITLKDGVKVLRDSNGTIRAVVQNGYCFLRSRYVVVLKRAKNPSSHGEIDRLCIVDQKTDEIIKDYGYVEPFSDEHAICQQYAYKYLNKVYPNWESPLEYWNV